MEFMKWLEGFNSDINGVVWGMPGLILLIGTGILMTCVTKFFQISHLKHWWQKTIGSMFTKKVMGHSKEKGSISAFQALCTALAATVGTGNIAGVASAICVGGAGAVFWMWVAAFFGMMTNFSENVLGMYFRRKNKDGEWSGGAMYYLAEGLGAKKNCKWIGKVLAILFSFLGIMIAYLGFILLFPFPAEVYAEDAIHNLASARKNGYTLLGCALGLPLVYLVDLKWTHFETRATWWVQILKVVGGLLIVVAVKELLRAPLDAIFGGHLAARTARYFLMVVFGGVLWPMTFRHLTKLAHKNT